jgi:RimJ/RimL family protein N-acetyltransferase
MPSRGAPVAAAPPRSLRSAAIALDCGAMNVIETRRLALRRLELRDAPFILGLLNQETFLRHIGDKGVRSVDDAREYLLQGPLASYQHHGFGLYLASILATGVPIGICGLVKRQSLPDADIGFALLPAYCGRGYAVESASAVLDYGLHTLGLPRIIAIVSPENRASIAVIEKIGLCRQGSLVLEGESRELELYGPPAQRAA